MGQKIDMGQLFREALESRLAEVHVSLPCKVKSYDKDKNTVSVIPLIKRKRRSKEGTTTATQIEALQNIPVAFLRSSKAWVTIPLAEGDVGMVVFAERSLKDWMGKQKGEVIETSDESLHPLDGAWFYPGTYPSKSPISNTNGDHPVFHTETELHLGEQGLSSDQFVALAKLVKDELTSLKSAIANHQHSSACTAGGGSTTANTFSWINHPGDMAATKVKAK